MQLDIKLTDLATTASYNTLAYTNEGKRVYAYTPIEDNNFAFLSTYYSNMQLLANDLQYLHKHNNGTSFTCRAIEDIKELVLNYISTRFTSQTVVPTVKVYSRYKLSISFLSCCITIEYR